MLAKYQRGGTPQYLHRPKVRKFPQNVDNILTTAGVERKAERKVPKAPVNVQMYGNIQVLQIIVDFYVVPILHEIIQNNRLVLKEM
jgi:hypothetical protein